MMGDCMTEKKDGMKKNMAKMILNISLKVLIVLVLLEALLTAGGILNKSMSKKTANEDIGDHTYVILALGDSMTYGGQDPWPDQLETLLNEESETEFKVIGSGLPGGDSDRVIKLADQMINEYNPDMVIAMMGITDQKEGSKVPRPISSLKTYKLAHFAIKKTGEAIERMKIKVLGRDKASKKYLIKASRYNDIGEDEKAEELLIKAMAVSPNSTETYFEMVSLLKKSRNYRGIEHYMKTVISIDPENERAYEELAKAYLKIPDYSEIGPVLLKLSEMNPKNTTYYSYLSWYYIKKEEYGKAEDAIQKGLEIAPKDKELNIKRYILLSKTGKAKDAEDSLREISSLYDAKSKSMTVDILQYYYELQMDGPLPQNMAQQLGLSEKELRYVDVMRYKFNNTIHSDTAIDTLKFYLKIQPADLDAYSLLEDQYKYSDKIENDTDLLKTALAIIPDSPVFYDVLRKSYQETGRSDEAIAFFLDLKENPRYDIWAYRALVPLYMETGRGDEAIRLIEGYIDEKEGKENQAKIDNMKVFLVSSYFMKDYDDKGWAYLGEAERGSYGFRVSLQRKAALMLREMGKDEKSDILLKDLANMKKGVMNDNTKENYNKLYDMLDDKGIRLAVMQYPTLSSEEQKAFFSGKDDIIFISNEDDFNEALREMSYDNLFIDRNHGSFGHCTALGNRMIAENAAEAILANIS